MSLCKARTIHFRGSPGRSERAGFAERRAVHRRPLLDVNGRVSFLSRSGRFAASKFWCCRAGADTYLRRRRRAQCETSVGLARKTVYGTANYAGCGLRCTQLRARETYREGLLNISPQSGGGVWAAGCNCELGWPMVMLCFSPPCANLREVRREGKCKALNGEKLAVDGFCGGVKCESRRLSCSRTCAAHAEERSCTRCRGFRMTSVWID
jgi:hypothetical protein